MKAKDVKVGMFIKATPFMEKPVEGLVENVRLQRLSGGHLVSLQIGDRVVKFRGSASVKEIKDVIE